MQQPDYSTKIFHERNDLVLFILSVMHGGYNMNIKCNQNLMFCKDRSMNSSVCCYHKQKKVNWKLILNFYDRLSLKCLRYLFFIGQLTNFRV